MNSTNPNKSHSTANQPLSPVEPLQNRLPRFNVDLLEPTIYEEKIAKLKKNLQSLANLSEPERDITFLRNFYHSRIEHYQNKIDTAHAWLVEVSSPKSL